jgi:hypothetical protein
LSVVTCLMFWSVMVVAPCADRATGPEFLRFPLSPLENSSPPSQASQLRFRRDLEEVFERLARNGWDGCNDFPG